MDSETIRRNYLRYFKDKQHTIVPSSPVVPHDDPTLLFTNAGMNQFKDVFLGKSEREYTRAASSQKCVRVGGKHNDLENVGHTRRHLTFFEMLGNFSFGDYFKKEAIQFAWEVSTNVLHIPPEKIWPTVFREDQEAFDLWTKYVPAEKITRFDEEDNFWTMGDTGPCGPCSELYFDRGPDYGQGRNPSEDKDGERYMEFWNLVFMQFNRFSDGRVQPLPRPSIDTGAGLERIACLLQGVDSLFETDVLRSLIAQVENVLGVPYDFHNPKTGPAFRVIADHLRCLSFAIADGAQPSNVDRGYVLRKLLRRAVRYGRILGTEEPFLAKVLPRLVDLMGTDFPEIKASQTRIAEILTGEEEAFNRTLRRGGNILNQIIEHAHRKGKVIDGDDAFKLKDTYGFPIEEIMLIAKDSDLSVDVARYQELELAAKERSRSQQKVAQQIASENIFADYIKEKGPSQFLGYTQHSALGKVTALVVDGQLVNTMNEGDEGMVVLDQTPFYAEMGGQIGDIGSLKGDAQFFKVTDCNAPYKGIIAHVGILEKGTLTLGMPLQATIDQPRRRKIANNHTATHLLHWALQRTLGEHIKQAGSVVDPHRLRFDFSHHKPLTQQEIYMIEDMVNEKIRENSPVEFYEISYEDAQKRSDIKQFFGEKYGSKVRVIDIDYSKELCGGTHTSATGNIGLFRVAKESSIAAGIRRIEAVTGEEAEALARQSDALIEACATALKTPQPKLLERIEKLNEENRTLLQSLKEAKKQQLEGVVAKLDNQIEQLAVPALVIRLDLAADELRGCADELMNRHKSLALVLASGSDDKGQILIRVSDDLVAKGIKANEMIKVLGPIIEGSGGGKPNNAQAGGKAPAKIGEALAKAKELLAT